MLLTKLTAHSNHLQDVRIREHDIIESRGVDERDRAGVSRDREWLSGLHFDCARSERIVDQEVVPANQVDELRDGR